MYLVELFGYIQSFPRNLDAVRVFFVHFYPYGQTFVVREGTPIGKALNLRQSRILAELG